MIAGLLALTRSLVLAAAVLVVMAGVDPAPAAAQSMGTGLMPANIARRYGLERAWFTQVEVGRGRGRVSTATIHVSKTRLQTTVEVFQGPSRWQFTEYERDAFGQIIGPDGAKKRAAEFAERLKKNSPAAGEPKVVVQVVPEVTLYVTSNQGLLQAIDGETGKTRWSVRVGSANYPTTGAVASEKHVALLNGSTLYVLRSTDGEMVWQKKTDGVPGATAAISDEYVFVPMVNGAIESYTLTDPKAMPWVYKSLGRSMVQPALAFGSLAWPTDFGHLYVASATSRSILYRLESRETIVATPTFASADRLIAPTVDGYVYCLQPSRQSSNILWKFSTGETLSQSPVVNGEFVYVLSDDRSLYSLSTRDGLPQWKSPGVNRIMAISGDRMYAVGEVGRIVVLDLKSGSRVATIPVDEFDLQVTNTVTDRLYYGTKLGTLQCLREVGHRWPVVFEPTDGKKPKPKPAAKPAAGEGPAAEPKPADNDDPFGAGAPAAPAKPAEPAGGDDPFGADPAPAGKPAPKPKDDADPFG
jgi:outer membrane protein assembly factor BamB